MKRRGTIFLKLILTCVLILILHFGFNFYQIKVDGLQAEIDCFKIDVDTKYSSDFSNRNFLKIQPGMTTQQVIDLIGLPLRRFAPSGVDSFYNGSHIGLKYSDATNDQSYRMRIVYISNGIVTQTRGEMYYD